MKNSVNSEKSPINNKKLSYNSSILEFEQRVRYSETDRMGVAHNSSYFIWFEIGRTEFCRQRNIPYKEIEAQGYYLVVVEALCRFRKPLRYDEKFITRVSLREITSKKVIFDYELWNIKKDKLIANGYTVHIVTNSQAKVSPLPLDIIKKMKS